MAMQWADILALDDAQLNAAIDTHVYGSVWERVGGVRESWWECTEADGFRTASSVPYFSHTASWERTMPLALRYSVFAVPVGSAAERTPHLQPREWVAYSVYRLEAHIAGLSPGEPQGIRVALCRLALWEAVQRQEQEALP